MKEFYTRAIMPEVTKEKRVSVNKVTLVGRLGQDPEVKQVNNQAVASFSVATSEKWKDKEGKDQEKTEWHSIVVWGKQAENAGKYLKKGRQVYIEGKLQTRSWEKEGGGKGYKTEIVAQNIQYLGDSGAGGGKDKSDPGPTPPPGMAEDEAPL